MTALEVRTLRQFLMSDQTIECDCTNYWVCAHTGMLRIEMAIQRLGWDFDFYAGRDRLAAHVYCSLCGTYRPTFRLGWRTRPGAYAGTHGAGMDTRSVLDPPARPRRWVEPDDFLNGGTSVRRFGPRR